MRRLLISLLAFFLLAGTPLFSAPSHKSKTHVSRHHLKSTKAAHARKHTKKRRTSSKSYKKTIRRARPQVRRSPSSKSAMPHRPKPPRS